MLQTSCCSLGFLAFGKYFPRSLLSFTYSEVDELEMSNCSVKLGISSFVSMTEKQSRAKACPQTAQNVSLRVFIGVCACVCMCVFRYVFAPVCRYVCVCLFVGMCVCLCCMCVCVLRMVVLMAILLGYCTTSKLN